MATDEHLTEKLIKYLNVINKTLKINRIYDFLLNFIEKKLISWIAEKPQNIMPNDKMKLIRVLHGKTRQTNRCLRYVIVFFVDSILRIVYFVRYTTHFHSFQVALNSQTM